MSRSPDVDEWLGRWSDEQREQVERVAGMVRAADGRIGEAVKWRRLTFTVDDDWHHWLCAIAVAKRGVALVFHKGVLLDDPAGLLEGEGRYVREISYERAAADPDAVTALVREAVARQMEMLDG